MSDSTLILKSSKEGDPKAAAELLPLVYGELRRLAAWHLANEKPGQTLQATALVHEAWIRLGGSNAQEWNSQTHFVAAAAQAMRRILIDRARSKARIKHGEGTRPLSLDDVDVASKDSQPEVVLAVSAALEKFALVDPQKAKLVELRYFMGMSIPEAAKTIGIAEATAKRHWVYARAWLYEELKSAV